MRLLDILLAEKEGKMKTNPWMIVSLVLAFACGCMVGSRPENEAEAAKPDWDYSMSTIFGSIVTVRWDRNLENPMPEIMVFPANTYNHPRVRFHIDLSFVDQGID